MEDQLNNNENTNSTVKVFGDNASPLFVFLSMVLSLWTIASNLFLLICFVKHRNNLIRSTFTMQILTLSVSDFLVGLSTLPIYVTGIISMVSYELCVFQFVVFISAQAVVLCHIFGICITRLFVVCHLTSPPKMSKKRGLITLYLVISWMVTLGIFSVPFGIWGKYRHRISICSLNEMFQDNYKYYTMYCVSFYIIPTLLTNAVYVAVLVQLRFSSCKTTVINPPSSDKDISTRSSLGHDSNVEENSKVNSNISDFKRLNETENNSVATNDSQGVCDLAFKRRSSTDGKIDKTITALQIFVTHQSCSSIGNEREETKRIANDRNDLQQPGRGSGRRRQTSRHRSTFNSHRNALSTIGMCVFKTFTSKAFISRVCNYSFSCTFLFTQGPSFSDFTD